MLGVGYLGILAAQLGGSVRRQPAIIMTKTKRDVLDKWAARFDALPKWLQPAALGALIVAGIVGIRLVFVLPLVLFTEPSGIPRLFIALIAAAAAGAAGGLAYSLVGQPMLRIPVIGRGLTGIVCVAAYLLPLLYFSTLIFGQETVPLTTPLGRQVATVCILAFGVFIGYSWFDAPRRPTGNE